MLIAAVACPLVRIAATVSAIYSINHMTNVSVSRLATLGIAGVQAMVAAGILTTVRAHEVLGNAGTV